MWSDTRGFRIFHQRSRAWSVALQLFSPSPSSFGLPNELEIEHRLVQPDKGTVRSLNGMEKRCGEVSRILLLVCCGAIENWGTTYFYNGNTFKFLRDHEWTPIVDWLNRIGYCNRRYVNAMSISARKLSTALESNYGLRYPPGDSCPYEIYKCNRRLAKPSVPFSNLNIRYGEVENKRLFCQIFIASIFLNSSLHQWKKNS